MCQAQFEELLIFGTSKFWSASLIFKTRLFANEFSPHIFLFLCKIGHIFRPIKSFSENEQITVTTVAAGSPAIFQSTPWGSNNGNTKKTPLCTKFYLQEEPTWFHQHKSYSQTFCKWSEAYQKSKALLCIHHHCNAPNHTSRNSSLMQTIYVGSGQVILLFDILVSASTLKMN